MHFERWFPVDLARLPERVTDIGLPLFRGDALSVRLGAELTRNGESAEAAGTVQGLAVLPNGMDILPFPGQRSGSRVWIDVPEEALVLPGRITLAIRLIDGEERTVILSACAQVRRADADATFDPSAAAPVWADVAARIARMDRAAAACEAAASVWRTETINLCDGVPIDGFAMMGSNANNQVMTANAARYNLLCVPIEPNTTYTISGRLLDGSTLALLKCKTATTQKTAGQTLDGSYFSDVGSGLSKFNKVFTSGANDHFLYIYGQKYDSNSRAYFVQVRKGAYSGFTANTYLQKAVYAKPALNIGAENTDFLSVRNVNLCDGVPIDGFGIIGELDNVQTLTANSSRYNLYIVPVKPNTTYTVCGRIDSGTTWIKIYTATRLLNAGDRLDGAIQHPGATLAKHVYTFTTGMNDAYLYLYGYHYDSSSRAHFWQVCEGTITDFTTDEYGVSYAIPKPGKLKKLPALRVVPVNASRFDLQILDEGTQEYFTQIFTLQNFSADLTYGGGSTKTVVCANVWYPSNFLNPDGNAIMQGNANFIHYVSNQGDGHKGHVGASHGGCVAAWTLFFADGKRIDPTALAAPLECETFRFQEKAEHYLNDQVTSQAKYGSDAWNHAVPTLDASGDPILTGTQYMDAVWRVNNRVEIHNRFDIALDGIQFSQIHAGMLCGFYPYFDNVIIENGHYLWTSTEMTGTNTFTNTDHSGTGIVIPAGATTGYNGDTCILWGEKYRAVKRLVQKDPARFGKSNILIWMPPSDDSRLKAYLMPAITAESAEAIAGGASVETFHTGDVLDTWVTLELDVI